MSKMEKQSLESRPFDDTVFHDADVAQENNGVENRGVRAPPYGICLHDGISHAPEYLDEASCEKLPTAGRL